MVRTRKPSNGQRLQYLLQRYRDVSDFLDERGGTGMKAETGGHERWKEREGDVHV